MSKATSSAATTNGKPSSSQPRLCHVIKVKDFDGYGFNLHAEKGKPGQYIGKVDDGSPAELAGLRQGDRIIEVNAVNIGRETHKEVVQRIKAIANEVQLLVVDPTVPVTKDNRLVTPIPVYAAVAKTNGTTTQPEPKPAVVLSTPDIVVQLPSSPSTPKDTTSHTSDTIENGHDEPDRAATTPSSPTGINGDDIIAIKVNNETVSHPIAVSSSKTSTFSTSPKNHGQRFSNSSFVSTASFSTSEVTEVKEESTTSVSTVIISSTSSPAPAEDQVPELPKSLPPTLDDDEPELNIPSVTSASASPPASPKPIVVAPTSPVVPIAPTVPTTPTVPTISTVPIASSNTTTSSLTNGSAHPAFPPPPSNGTATTLTTATTTTTTTTTGSGLNLNMTAAELRAKLAARKKFDPKSGSVDLRKKFEIVEKL